MNVQCPGNLYLYLKDVLRPTAGADDILIRVAATDVCGMDIDRRSMGGLTPASSNLLELGHEFTGQMWNQVSP
jgi:threonine dehydrogenase-like Zn-dependent dehydrogenase